MRHLHRAVLSTFVAVGNVYQAVLIDMKLPHNPLNSYCRTSKFYVVSTTYNDLSQFTKSVINNLTRIVKR